MEYIRLTKAKQDNVGRVFVTCKFEGTAECPIHSCENCGNCIVFQKMLIQLHTYENMFEEKIKAEVK